MRTLASILCMASLSAFAATKENPPQSPPPKPFHLPATDDFTLANGMKVTIVPYGVVPKVAIRAFVNAGSLYESSGQVWLSRLNASMMKEGTSTRSAEQIAREAADMGGQLEIDAGSEFTSAGGVVLSDFGTNFIGLLADVLKHASLPAAEIARLKADLGRELAVAKTEPGSLARERFFQVLFPGHPYGRVFPSEKDLQGYTVEDVQSFYRKNFGASRTHLYVAGKLDPGLR